jgi:hypothetical protein
MQAIQINAVKEYGHKLPGPAAEGRVTSRKVTDLLLTLCLGSDMI